MLGYSIRSPDFPHDRELIAIEPTRKLGAHHFPRIASIVAAKEFVGGEVKPRVRVRADDERRVPIKSVSFLARQLLGLDSHSLAGAFVESNQHAVLQLRIDRVRVFWIDLTAKAVPTLS